MISSPVRPSARSLTRRPSPQDNTVEGPATQLKHGGNLGIALLEVLLTRMPIVSVHFQVRARVCACGIGRACVFGCACGIGCACGWRGGWRGGRVTRSLRSFRHLSLSISATPRQPFHPLVLYCTVRTH